MISVLITDDHPIVRQGILQILEDDERIGKIRQAANGKELLEKVISEYFDVVLLDISLPGRNGLELLSEVKKLQPGSAVLMLSIYP